MNIDFSNKDLLLIYGHFKKKIKQLQLIKDSPDNPIHLDSINQDIELYSSITEKIENVHPKFEELEEHL